MPNEQAVDNMRTNDGRGDPGQCANGWSGERVAGMARISADDYMRALEDVGQDDGEDGPVYTHEGPEDISEAERMAQAADGPKVRADGRVVGAAEWKRDRPLTQSQMAFAQGLIAGKSMRQAYRDAYPNSGAADVTVSASASKLAKDPRIAKLVREAWEETQEALADDIAATKRYVMRSLVALSKQANQEGSRLKALELLGRSAGMWRDQQQSTERPLTAAELKAALSGHLKLVGQTQRKRTGTDDA